MPANRDLARLKALAEKATPGPWSVFDGDRPGIEGDGGRFSIVLYGDSGENEGIARPEDAAYIAALDPATVLALIARAERAEERTWRPIKSAPKDGSYIIICDDRGILPDVASWRNEEPAHGAYLARPEGWFNVSRSRIRTPTHWAPIPQEPT